jgi:hypothetical protein
MLMTIFKLSVLTVSWLFVSTKIDEEEANKNEE